MKIWRKYKEGAFHMVEVEHDYTIYVRETYTGIHYTWYEKPYHMISIKQHKQEELETIYKKLKNENTRSEKLERILKNE